MDAVQEPRKRDLEDKKTNAQATAANPLSERLNKAPGFTEQSGTRRETDLFQELRERKLRETPLRKAAPQDDVEDEVAVSFPGWTRWFLAALIGGVICLFFVNSLKSGDDGKITGSVLREPVSEEQGAAVLAALKSKYNARNWDSALSASRRTNPLSIEISDAFLRDYSRPVLVRGTLLDVAYGSRNIEATFALPGLRGENQDCLILRCSKDQLKLFADARRGVSEFAVVADCYETQNTATGFSIIGSLVDAANFSTAAKK